MTIKVLVSCCGAEFSYTQGEMPDARPEVAEDLIAAGYAEAVDETPPPVSPIPPPTSIPPAPPIKTPTEPTADNTAPPEDAGKTKAGGKNAKADGG